MESMVAMWRQNIITGLWQDYGRVLIPHKTSAPKVTGLLSTNIKLQTIPKIHNWTFPRTNFNLIIASTGWQIPKKILCDFARIEQIHVSIYRMER